MVKTIWFVAAIGALVRAHQAVLNDELSPLEATEEWAKKYGKQYDQTFSGPLSFAHLTYARCLDDVSHTTPFDIAILGMPFDTAVTYRPGARFGPFAIRSGARRLREARGYSLSWNMDPYTVGSRIVDCGDVSFITIPFPGNTQLVLSDPGQSI